MKAIIGLCGAVLAIACGGQAVEEDVPANDVPATEDDESLYVDVEPETLDVPVVLQQHEALPAELMLAACEAWTGMTCYEAPAAEAKVSVMVDDLDCVRDEDGNTALGGSGFSDVGPRHEITVYVSCMMPDDVWVPEQADDVYFILLQFVIEHELGHHLGIPHIKRNADEPDKPGSVTFYDERGPLIGPARMNPGADISILETTSLDRRAFAVREPGFLWPKAKGSPVANRSR